MTGQPALYTVPVDGGELTVARWGDATPVVIAAHGITSSHRAWSTVADELDGDVTLLAPDLRGRGDSATLPGPHGMVQHARDLAAVLDHAGVERAVVAGHSMGGLVAAVFADMFARSTRAVVMVDGGPTIGDPVPDDVDVDAVLAQLIGPAIARLEQRFPSRDAYRRFWREHPAFQSDIDVAQIDAYADHDLHGPDGEMRSKVSADAVRADARESLLSDTMRTALERISAPAVLLLAERGLLDGPVPLYPAAAVEGLRTADGPLEVVRVGDTNHYSICLGRNGARAIAQQVRRFALDGGRS